jgi:hypothetical protein
LARPRWTGGGFRGDGSWRLNAIGRGTILQPWSLS